MNDDQLVADIINMAVVSILAGYGTYTILVRINTPLGFDMILAGSMALISFLNSSYYIYKVRKDGED